MNLKQNDITAFRRVVWDYFAAHQRPMPWRECRDPYWIVVSEIMLQQTQVERVRPKFEAFVATFPHFGALAHAPLSQVMNLWVGLGYNRRARFLHLLAKEVVERYNGTLPADPRELVTFPGVGPNTAGAIAAYAFNAPVTFVETNIRTVLLHHFFAGKVQVSEQELRAVAEAVLDKGRSREWHWALMDYGVYLKKTEGNNIARSKAYRKQSAFVGSLRQVRGQVIAVLSATGSTTPNNLANIITDPRLPQVLHALHVEKLIILTPDRVQLAE